MSHKRLPPKNPQPWSCFGAPRRGCYRNSSLPQGRELRKWVYYCLVKADKRADFLTAFSTFRTILHCSTRALTPPSSLSTWNFKNLVQTSNTQTKRKAFFLEHVITWNFYTTLRLKVGLKPFWQNQNYWNTFRCVSKASRSICYIPTSSKC